MVYQEPGRALNPSIRIGGQLTEAIKTSNSLPNESDRLRPPKPCSLRSASPIRGA